MNLLQRLQAVMAHYGLTPLNTNFLPSSAPLRDVLAVIECLFLRKTYDETIDEIIDKKHRIQTEVLGLSFCPFEKMTGVNWTEMFQSAHYCWTGKDKKRLIKNVVPFFHFFLPSSLFRHESLARYTVAGTRFEAMFNYTGKPMVRIKGTKYVYGEAGIIIDPKGSDKQKPYLRTQVSAVVFDEMILPTLLR